MIIYWDNLEKSANDDQTIPEYIASNYVPSVHFARNIYWEGKPRESGKPENIPQYIASDYFIRGLNIQPITWDGWLEAKETWTYNTAQIATVASGATTRYQKGDKIRWKQGGEYKYGCIKAVTDTAIEIIKNTVYTFTDSGITNNYISRVANPMGYPHWFNYEFTEITASGSMTVSDVIYSTCRYRYEAGMMTIHFRISMTLGGTASTTLTLTGLPIKRGNYNARAIGIGFMLVDGWGIKATIDTTSDNKINISKCDGGNMTLGSGRGPAILVSYQA